MARRNNDLVHRMTRENKTICEYCGKEKHGISFVIGASVKPDWVMVEGTGKMACPDCWTKARDEGEEVVRRHTGL